LHFCKGVADSMPNKEDHVEELPPDQFTTPSPSTRNQSKRKHNSTTPKKTSPWKKGKNPMVRVMSRMVDDEISANFVTSKALSDDFTHESIREVMTLVKEVGAIEGSDEHFIATQSKITHFGRSRHTTQNVMDVCDFDMRFTFVVARWPDSVHDTRFLMKHCRNMLISFYFHRKV
jgi:hypothetical protein